MHRVRANGFITAQVRLGIGRAEASGPGRRWGEGECFLTWHSPLLFHDKDRYREAPTRQVCADLVQFFSNR